jgi:hypothetical protein
MLPSEASVSAFSSSSAQDRATGWRANLELVMDAPLGIGVAKTAAAADKVQALQGGEKAFQPDNYYYKVGLELGVFGLWTFIVFLVAAFRSGRSLQRHAAGSDGAFGAALAAFTLAAAAACLWATFFVPARGALADGERALPPPAPALPIGAQS